MFYNDKGVAMFNDSKIASDKRVPKYKKKKTREMKGERTVQ